MAGDTVKSRTSFGDVINEGGQVAQSVANTVSSIGSMIELTEARKQAKSLANMSRQQYISSQKFADKLAKEQAELEKNKVERDLEMQRIELKYKTFLYNVKRQVELRQSLMNSFKTTESTINQKVLREAMVRNLSGGK